MTELTVVLVLLAFVASLSVPFGLEYVRSGQTQRLFETARSIGLVAQRALTEQRNAGQLNALLNRGEGMVLTLPEELVTDTQSGKVCAMLLSGGEGGGNAQLLALLSPYLAEKTLREQAICVEFNAETGIVQAVFYSEEFPAFFYDAQEDEPNNIQKYRESTWQIGVYRNEGEQTDV